MLITNFVYAENKEPVAKFISVQGRIPNFNKDSSTTAVFVKKVENKSNIVSAKWNVSGLGVFRVYLNGKEIGAEDFLKPGFTHPQKRRASFFV